MDFDGTPMTAGLDEAGMGPIAGPAAFGVAVLRDDVHLSRVRDSKKLTTEQKYEAAAAVWLYASHHDVLMVSVDKINEDGIGLVWQQAMYRLIFAAVAKFPVDRIVVDGNKRIREDAVDEEKYSRRGDYRAPKVEYIVKADDKILAVSAASVLAKCEQLEYMEELHLQYPEYGFGGPKGHHGYGVPVHIQAIKKYGAIRGVHRVQYVQTIASNQGFELRWVKS